MGIIKTAIMTGGGLYAVNKLAKVAETRQTNRPCIPSNDDNNYMQRDSRDNQSQPSQFYNGSPPSFPQLQQSRQIASGEQEQYYYLNKENVWSPLPREYSNMRSASGVTHYPEQRRLPPPDYRPQQLEFDYPQDCDYVEADRQSGSRSMMSADTANKAMGFVMNTMQTKSGEKKGKVDGLSDIMSMFSK